MHGLLARARRVGHIELSFPTKHPAADVIVSAIPVLPPNLRPSTRERVHPITASYQRILTATDPDILRAELGVLFDAIRDEQLRRVAAELESAAAAARAPDTERVPSSEIFDRARLDANDS